ncbi:MAG: endolytic transglycosylase MltG [Clostridiales bacterium]|nr:endolytic transglycosylase MltG [Clostridiales bacterium]
MADDELRKEQETEEEEKWPTFDWKEGIFSSQQNGEDETDATKVIKQDAPQPEPEPEQPRREPKKKKKHMSVQATVLSALVYLLGVLLISYGIATVGWTLANDVLALNKEELTATITIVSGESVDEIAEDLQEAGLIEYPLLFKLFAAFTGKAEDGKIVSGTYELTTDMDYSALLTSIGPQSPVRSVVTVTIPEGYTMEEIFALLEENGVCSAEDLMEAAETEDFDYDFLDNVSTTGASRLEGYLFPDTYEFYMQASATSVINKLLSNFETRFDEEMQARMEELDMTMEEVMIVASIIEKETDGQDQKDIASVIYNRLSEDNTETNGYLQMDSTIQYLLDERKETLTAEDLAIDSPYNTYLYPGLPVGCICCPGLDAIEAALNPNDTDYYYFYLGNDGSTYFFSDYTSFMQFREEQIAETEADSEEEDTTSAEEDDAA